MVSPSKAQVSIKVHVLDHRNNPIGAPIMFVGREAWACRELIKAGERGVSSLHHIGPRLAHYCMKIRRAGLTVEMVKTPHAGSFAGWHGVYFLRSKLRVIEDKTERLAA
ncbi:winged helix domain-containing protein [Neorhizobium sp. DT-125]|uniref:winged helix domain-containing protein n=1 Tax=Neorhizobium sp. DT-125 TaxID=3396163 RepID=UPI003F19D9A3